MVKSYRVVVLGMKGVGKTAILQQAVYRDFHSTTRTYPTVEDIYVGIIETERGSKEHMKFYDTHGIDSSGGGSPFLLSAATLTNNNNNNENKVTLMMQACKQIARHYTNMVDGFILVYDVSRSDSLDCAITMKKEIEKSRERKEGVYVMLGHRMNVQLSSEDELLSDIALKRAISWALKEKIQHFEVNALDRKTLYQPFIYIASRLTTSTSRSSFSQLSMVRKTIRSE